MKKTILALILATIIINPSFAALKKSSLIHGRNYEHNVLMQATYDRSRQVIVVSYNLYANTEHYTNTPLDQITTRTLLIPFSQVPNSHLLDVLNYVEAATKREILNASQINTNYWTDAETVDDK